MGVVIDPVQHERQALAEMPEDEREIGKCVEHAGKDQAEKCVPVSMPKPQAASASSSYPSK